MALKEVKGSKSKWDSDGLVVEVEKSGKVNFILGCQAYETSNGEMITVGFTPTSAFLFTDDLDSEDASDFWSGKDLKDNYLDGSLKEGQFPYGFDQNYIQILSASFDIETGEDSVGEIDNDALEKVGLDTESISSDIYQRLSGLSSFRVETDLLQG